MRGAGGAQGKVTPAEQQIVLRLAQQEPGALLSLLAGCLAPVVAVVPPPAPCLPEPVRRPGDDPYLITEDEFSFRARSLSREEQAVLRCRVNAARANRAGDYDFARRQRQRADRLERRLGAV